MSESGAVTTPGLAGAPAAPGVPVVLVFGATSPIADAVAAEYAKRGARMALAARDLDEAERHGADLRVRYGVDASVYEFDARQYGGHDALVRQVAADFGRIDIAVIAFGDLGDREASIRDFEAARAVLETNYVGAASACEAVARHMVPRRSGTIVGISSVAGDRGRYSNYFYGSAKGGFSIYLQGLRARCFHERVHVLTVKPGPIDTSMTWGVKKGRVPIASPEALARAIVNAESRRKDTLYYPGFWRWIMALIKAVPESRWKRIRI